MKNEQKQQAADEVYRTGDEFFKAIMAAEKQGLKVDVNISWQGYVLEVKEHVRYNRGTSAQESLQALWDIGDTRLGCRGAKGPNGPS